MRAHGTEPFASDPHARPPVEAATGPLPPPSPALRAALGDLHPVRTRRPLLAAVGFGALSIAWSAALLLGIHGARRPDLASVSPLRLALVLSAGAAVFLFFLAAAFIPRRGQVLPWLGPARGAVWSGLALALLGLLLAAPAGPRSFVPPATLAAFARYARSCGMGALVVAIVPVALALGSLRRSLPLGGGRVGARIGAAVGGLLAMVMALHCPIVGAAHVGLVHGGEVMLAVVVASLFGGWVLTASR